MKRTQIYIDEETYGKLKKESKLKGISISEIIRESVQKKLSSRVDRMIRATDSVSGLWKDRRFDVDEFIRTARKDRKACS
jgi:predicted CopG family antitoxin